MKNRNANYIIQRQKRQVKEKKQRSRKGGGETGRSLIQFTRADSITDITRTDKEMALF